MALSATTAAGYEFSGSIQQLIAKLSSGRERPDVSNFSPATLLNLIASVLPGQMKRTNKIYH